jgi:hypothetical protein
VVLPEGCVDAPWLGNRRIGHQFVRVAMRFSNRRSRSLASETDCNLHRGESRLQAGNSRNGGLGRLEQESLLASVQTNPWVLPHGVCRSTASRARQTHDGIHGAAAHGYCIGLRIRRSVASEQILSPHSRREPGSLASRVPIRNSGLSARLRGGVKKARPRRCPRVIHLRGTIGISAEQVCSRCRAAVQAL